MYHANEMNTPFPRLCAHRGFNALAPENSLPALTMAMAIGAQEIEMDVWTSKDGDLIVCHDPTVDRTTNGTGRISDLTTKELLSLDAGSYYSPAYRGIRLPLFEEVLDLAAGKVILDIHIKSPGRVYRPCEEIRARNRIISQGYWNHAVIMRPLPEEAGEIFPEEDVSKLAPFPEKDFQKLLDLLDKYISSKGTGDIAGFCSAHTVTHYTKERMFIQLFNQKRILILGTDTTHIRQSPTMHWHFLLLRSLVLRLFFFCVLPAKLTAGSIDITA